MALKARRNRPRGVLICPFSMKLRWRFGIIAGLFLAVFSLYPQMKMLYLRGDQWNGHYAYNDIDEVAYAGYIKALIDGRPRKNDPYTGRDDSAETPQAESLFSIQFAAPYTIALPARLLGIGAPWAMTISGAIAAFLTALAIFWLIGMITGDSLYAMADALIVLCLGALFAGEGAIGEITGWSYAYPYFPGFRRYVPAMAMPAVFALVALVWKMVGGPTTNNEQRTTNSPLLIILATLAFGYTVFSYFYIWTTAVAWLGCLGLCWLVVRPDGWLEDVKRLATLGVGCVISLVPYAYLLSQRAETLDDVQVLVFTRELDLTRSPELIGFGVLLGLAVAIAAGVLSLRDRGTLFAISLALAPAILFNQQVITGRSLQPIHYQVFVGNYVAGIAVVVAFALVWRRIESRNKPAWRVVIGGLSLIAAAWGFVECHYTVRILDDVNIARDEAYPAGMRLAELAKDSADPRKDVVLHLGMAEADDLPTLAPQSVLWARHQHIFAGVTTQENKERYYQLLYYQNVSPGDLANGMKRDGDFVSMIALFGWGRHTDRLNAAYKPLTYGEIDAEARLYGEYAARFDANRDGVPLRYLIAPLGLPDEAVANLDKWYSRDAGEAYGKYVLYRLTPR
jgi:hypothetical protein